MPTKKTKTSSATNQKLKTFHIHYSIRDGDNEYRNSVIVRLPDVPETDRELVEAVLRWMIDPSDKKFQKDIERCVKEYEEGGYFELPDDYRFIEDLYVKDDAHDELVERLKYLRQVLSSVSSDTPFWDNIFTVMDEAIDKGE